MKMKKKSDFPTIRQRLEALRIRWLVRAMEYESREANIRYQAELLWAVCMKETLRSCSEELMHEIEYLCDEDDQLSNFKHIKKIKG